MKLFISIISLLLTSTFLAQNAFASSLFKTSNNSAKVQEMLIEVDKKLPESFRARIWEDNNKQPIEITFENLGELQLPDCDIIVDSYSKAEEIEKEYANVQKDFKGYDLRYNRGVYSAYDAKNKRVVLNSNLISYIEAGPRVNTYSCEHKDAYLLAQGSLINALVRMIDTPMTQKTSNKNTKSASQYKLSDTLIYRYRAGWDRDGNTKKDKKQAFWPRAINPYEYAGDVHDSFALNVEFFILDPEYACRKPLYQEYFVSLFKEDPQSTNRDCKINTKLQIPYQNTEAFDNIRAQTQYSLVTYDLDPKRVYNVNYFLAGIGTGAGAFGHSMFRIVTCDNPNEPVTANCQRRQSNLIINPRANPLEMRLDNLKGAFGGYPSMFLVTPTHEIIEEYSVSELRNSYNVPLTGYETTDELGNPINVMHPDDKIRFLYATLDQYWNYYGSYKFLSNNCSDEALRLYQMASTNPEILNYDPKLTKPFKIATELGKEGLANPTDLNQQEKDKSIMGALASMIFRTGNKMKWDDFEEKCDLFSEMEFNNKTTHKSWKCHFYASLRQIMILEGAKPKDVDNTKDIEKRFKTWLKLATPNKKISKQQAEVFNHLSEIPESKKQEILQSTILEIRNLWLKHYGNTQTTEDKIKVTKYFYTVIDHIYWKRAEQIGNMAVQLAYEIAYHPGQRGKEDAPKLPKNLQVSTETVKAIREAIDNYAEIERSLMPYRELSVKRGYGIPLEKEVVRDQRFVDVLNSEQQALSVVVESVSGILGAEHVMLAYIGELMEDISKARIHLEH